MIELTESRIYEFGEFRLDEKSHCLFRCETGELVPLTSKAVELLLFLVKNTGRVLIKDEILEAVWENSFVEEANLSQTIFVLRKTLGENAKKPRFILTIPNRGYQFIAEVREFHAEDKILEESFLSDDSKIQSSRFKIQDSNPKSKIQIPKLIWFAVPMILLIVVGIYWFLTKPKPPPTAINEIKTIAILPFTNIGGKTDEEYLGQGLSEVLISKLSNVKTIIVRPNRAVQKYSDASPDPKKIGNELDVEAILVGRVQKIDENIRVTVQLVRTSDGATLWAETFDDKFTNIFAVQDSISARVTESLAIKLGQDERRQLPKITRQTPKHFNFIYMGFISGTSALPKLCSMPSKNSRRRKSLTRTTRRLMSVWQIPTSCFQITAR
ncbi:MAG TPA: FlgO family outer membrane protein [Pyrinomonadaceae bacterium]|nr:FlgO family outer membrane protein [Pyrinomonadaceae bacterium]